jgi:zinc/manganese transport system substrate-binding protein/manganese/iron transport system substrate-binding protein
MSFSRRLFVTFTAAAAVATRLPAVAQPGPLRVAVSTPLIADIVRNVAGGRAEVFSVMPEDADPHTWEASPQDIVAVTEASTFISVGAHLEPFIEAGPWRRAVKDGGIPELVLTDHVDLIVSDRVIDHGDHTHDLTDGDPHIWLDPQKVIAIVPVIRDHLAGLDPDGAPAYSEAAAAYVASLGALDSDLVAACAAIPAERRKLIVFHDAWQYFAARFGFEVIGVVLHNPDAEISAEEIVELQRTIEESGVRVIFAEPQFNTEVLDIFVHENDVTIGELLTDSFSGKVGSYIEMMRFNQASLTTHLGS